MLRARQGSVVGSLWNRVGTSSNKGSKGSKGNKGNKGNEPQAGDSDAGAGTAWLGRDGKRGPR